jgi:hypothetical protein
MAASTKMASTATMNLNENIRDENDSRFATLNTMI